MKQVYTEEELQRFEAELRDKEEELRRKKEKLQEQQDLLQERGRALEAQRREYQQVTRMKYSFIHAASPWNDRFHLKSDERSLIITVFSSI